MIPNFKLFSEIIKKYNAGVMIGVHTKENGGLAITLQDSIFLASFITYLQPKIIVEIGTGYGVSSTWMALALKANGLTSSRIHTIEITDRPLDIWGTFGVADWVTYYQGTTVNEVVLPENIDIAFVDEDHTEECVIESLIHLYPKIRPGGFIVGHDPIYCPGVRGTFRDFSKQNGCQIIELIQGQGLMILQKPGPGAIRRKKSEDM